jgi:hypothetical protein
MAGVWIARVARRVGAGRGGIGARRGGQGERNEEQRNKGANSARHDASAVELKEGPKTRSQLDDEEVARLGHFCGIVGRFCGN